MTTTTIRIIYRRPTERLAARLGRALVRWADDRAVVSHDRQLVALANERGLRDRRRSEVARQHLRG